MHVVVTPYDPNWPQGFQEEARRIRAAFGSDLITIHHIGSTSVPDLAAKPILDLLPVVRRIASVDGKTSECLRGLGYEGFGEYGLPGRRYFRKGGDRRTHQLHVYAFDNPEVARHLAFRDYLRVRPHLREAYGELKVALAARFPKDIEGYMDGKDGFIKTAEAKAVAWWSRVPCLFINGTVGVGKTTTLEAVAAALDRRGIAYLAVDLDALTDTNTRPEFDPFGFGLMLTNLEAAVQRGRSMGARVILMAGVLERVADGDAVREAVPGAELFTVRLDAAASVVEERLRRRMAPIPDLDWHLRRRGELQAILERARLEDAVVTTDDEAPDLVAARVLELWQPARMLA